MVLERLVNAYKYVGVRFSTHLSFSHSPENQTAKAKTDIAEIQKKTYGSLAMFLRAIVSKLFDSQIKPVWV